MFSEETRIRSRERTASGTSAAYGFQFKEIKDIDIGLKYQALRNGDIDVTNGYTTDAQISQDDVRALEKTISLIR